MKKNDVHTGATYWVKVSGKMAPVKITGEHRLGGWSAINTKTGKAIRIKSAQRLRGPAKAKDPQTTKAAPPAPAAVADPKVAPLSKAELAMLEAVDAKDRAGRLRKATGAKPKKAPKTPRPMGLLDAAAAVLARIGGASMDCKAMVETAVANGLWTPGKGKTPSATLYSAILRENQVKGKASRFVKTDRGKFASNTKTA